MASRNGHSAGMRLSGGTQQAPQSRSTCIAPVEDAPTRKMCGGEIMRVEAEIVDGTSIVEQRIRTLEQIGEPLSIRYASVEKCVRIHRL